jgi:DNA-binding response OmpR family regulator
MRRKKKVVLIEDDADILLTLNIILDEAGYEVQPFSSPLPVIEGNYSFPDLYILDKRMPDMDGLEVCRYLKSEISTKHIPVIVISASPKFGPQALKAGADAFMAKPFEMTALLALVKQHINSAPKERPRGFSIQGPIE